jgi:nucleotide-binding universal stress UspA family protein
MNTLNDNKVMACVDPSPYAQGVVDYAAWAAARLQAPLELLHIIDVHNKPLHAIDHSGAIGLDAQETLLQQLSEEDRANAQQARQSGRVFLARLRKRTLNHGVPEVDMRQRHGTLAETLSEQESRVRLIVLGRRGESAVQTYKDLGRHVEHMVRALHKPILTVTDTFTEPTRIVFAFDGSAVTRRGIDTVATSPLLKGLPIHLQMCGAPSKESSTQLEAAQSKLRMAGFEVTSNLQVGDPKTVIPQVLQNQQANLLVMGAYTHSPWRSLLMGSKTNSLLRASPVATLLLR